MAARALLDRAVACRLPEQGKLGVHLSGGLDSSGLAATAARLLGDEPLDAFHRAPGTAHPYNAMDERALVDAVVARYPNISLTVIASVRQAEEDIDPERDAAKFFVPRMRGLNAGWFAPMVDAIRASDPAVVFSGGVGNLTLSFEGDPHFAGDLRAGRCGQALRSAALAAEQRGQSLPRFVASRYIKPLLPGSLLRWRADRTAGEHSRWATYSMVSDEFLASIDYAARVRDTAHDLPFQGLVSRAMRLHALQAQRNRDKQFAERRAGGPDTIDPYADRRLVEFTLGIPETQFWHAGQDRWLARRVLADRLPPQLLRERRRGLQSPDWFDAASRRREGMAAAIDRISRSPLASRVVDVPRMKKLLDAWPSDAAAAKKYKQVYGYALARGISIGGFLRWHEGGNE
ncbi:asparagine synthase-related protein [Sphingomonas sp. MMS24-J45]|uniref:asparagine synthase-related protein n=1 Tax=Sphingomonas sp. MMS24-J45 TaxID=3238806 RepID=UPI00384B2556